MELDDAFWDIYIQAILRKSKHVRLLIGLNKDN